MHVLKAIVLELAITSVRFTGRIIAL